MDTFDFNILPFNKLGGLAGFLALIVCVLVLEYINKAGHENKTEMSDATISHIAENGTPKKVFITGMIAISLLNLLFLYGIIHEFRNEYAIIIEGYSISVSAFMILMATTVGVSVRNIHLKFASFFFGALFITQIAINIIIFNQNSVLSLTGFFLTLSAIPLTYLAVKKIKRRRKKNRKLNGILELAFIGPQLLWILLFATYLVV